MSTSIRDGFEAISNRSRERNGTSSAERVGCQLAVNPRLYSGQSATPALPSRYHKTNITNDYNDTNKNNYH